MTRSKAKDPLAADTKASDEKQNPATDFFTPLLADLEKLAASPDVIVSIPCWGWPGDGKTCSLLTAIHFCDVASHGISLARVKDGADLDALEKKQPGYQGLGLAAIAEATNARLGTLNQVFLADNDWPPGTETASFYLLEARTQQGRVAYALLPDLRGGSFQQTDAAARTVIDGAHAFIVMVNAEKFVEASANGKEYKDDVIGRLQRCASAGIPTCVMLGQADRISEQLVDRTHKELAALLSKVGLNHQVFRVSVIADTPTDAAAEGTPPPLIGRSPEQLVRAWTWTLHAALTRDREHVLAKVPGTNLADGARMRAPKAARVRELRLICEDQGTSNQVLCASPRKASSFLLLDANGQLTEATVQNARLQLQAMGQVDASAKPATTRAAFRSGHIFLSGDQDDTKMWHGLPGALRETALPIAPEAWTPLDERTIALLDAKGTLHVLRLAEATWNSLGYVASLIKETKRMALALSSAGDLIASNGESCVGVKLDASGKPGDRLAVQISVPYAQGPAMINQMGVVAARGASNEVIMGREKAHALGTTTPDAPRFALAPEDATVAWVSAENTLLAATGIDKPLTTEPSTAAKLSEVPQRICWDARGQVLLATFATGKWCAFQRFGF